MFAPSLWIASCNILGLASCNQNCQVRHENFPLTLLLLNMTCPVLANSVDPDQLASEEAN